MKEGTESGWVRLIPGYSEVAVSWWFVRSFHDGFTYARGGRVRSARAARRTIKDHWQASIAEHNAFKNRRTHALGDDGQLIPLDLAMSGSMRMRELSTGRRVR